MTAATLHVPASVSNDSGSSVKRAGHVLIAGGRGQLATELHRTTPAQWTAGVLGSQELDVTDEMKVREALESHRPDVVINTAAYNDVDGAETNAQRAYAVNADGPAHLARACAAIGARMVHISTDFVFGGDSKRPYQLADVPAPLSVYGASKLQGEENVNRILGDDAVILRTAWVYSAHGRNFVTKMLAMMRRPEPLRVVSDQAGSPTWTRSLAAAIWRVLELPDLHGIQHWTDSGVVGRYDFAVAIRDEAIAHGILECTPRIEPVLSSEFAAAARRPAYSVLDTQATQRALGIEVSDWRSNLRDMMSNAATTGEIA